MLFRLKFLSFFVIIVLTVLYKVHTKQIDIVRGEHDLFTNPKCSDGNNQLVRCTNCEGLNAVCVNKNCSSCRCIGNNTTFVSMREKYGQCVENEYLLYLTSYNSSFLVQEKNNKKCLYPFNPPKKSKYIFLHVTDSCNYSTSSQRWIWNRNGQLINTKTLECLEEGFWQMKNSYFVLLKKCNLNEKKQLWRCEGEGSYFFSQQNSGRYMNYGHYGSYITSYLNISTARQWTRFGTNQQSICSDKVNGKMDTEVSLALDTLGWDTLEQKRTKQLATSVFKARNNFYPTRLKSIFEPNI